MKNWEKSCKFKNFKFIKYNLLIGWIILKSSNKIKRK